MARPLWKGSLGFGLVTVPVEMYKAVRDLGPHFHFLRRSDKSRIGYQKIATEDGEPVSQDELVKGYEYEKGRYIILTEQDFESAAVERDSRIDLLDFVDGAEVDDRYFNTPYYLLPSKGGDKAYVLLREALRESGRIGIAKIVLRSKAHLAAVEVIDKALVLSTLRFRDELVPVSEYDFPNEAIRKPELKIAHQLVEALVDTWDPDKYTDEYRANLMKIIEAKRKRQKPELERQEIETDTKVVDLMERLRRSLGEATSGPARRATTKKKKGASKKRASRKSGRQAA